MKRAFVSVALVCLCAGTVWGGGLGIFGSYWNTEDAEDGFGAGAKLQLDFAALLKLEARATYFPDFGDGEDAAEIDVGDVSILAAEFGGVIILLEEETISPYVGAGAGYYPIEIEATGAGGTHNEEESEWGAYLLAGFEFGEGVVLFAEAKYTTLDASVSLDEVFSGGEEGHDHEQTLDGLGANIGFLMKW